jgi:hypothetical protein
MSRARTSRPARLLEMCARALPLLLAAAGCTSAWKDGERLTYTADETNRALAPVRPLQQRCYAGSASEREKRAVALQFILYIDAHGAVRSDPQAGYPSDPALLECLRTGLNELQFPAKGEADQFRVNIELKP